MKRFLFLCIWLLATCIRAAVPTFESFSVDQFQTNGLRVFYRDPHTNDNGIIYPAIANTLTLVTNENVYGTFSLPAKVTLLALGTNYLDVATNTTWLLNSPTNDATQVILSLSAGAYQGQLLFVTSQNGSNSFTLPDLSEQWDTPGAFVDIQGDWVGTTNRGIILQYTAPDWIEMARFDPGQTGGGTVFGSGTAPKFPYWITATTLGTSTLVFSNASNIRLDSTNTLNPGKFLIQGPSGSALMDITGDGTTAHFQGGSVGAYLANAAGFGVIALGTALVPTVNNTLDLGASGSLRWKNLSLDGHINWNGATNSVYDLAGAGSPEGVVTASSGSLYRDYANGTFYGKTNGVGNTGWGILLAGSGSAALWASAGGVLSPSPAVDLVNITSQLADNATNVALVVDTAVQWAAGNTNALISFMNGGAKVGYVDPFGGYIRGSSDAVAVWSFGSGVDAFIFANSTEAGDSYAWNSFVGSIADVANSVGAWFHSFGTTNSIRLDAFVGTPLFNNGLSFIGSDVSGELKLSYSGVDVVSLHPTVASTGSATAYLFDTANVLTNGDMLVSIGNAGTPLVQVDANGGTIYRGANTLATYGGTDPNVTLMSFRNTSAGDSAFNGLRIGVAQNSAFTNYTQFDVRQTLTANQLIMSQASFPLTNSSVINLNANEGEAGFISAVQNVGKAYNAEIYSTSANGTSRVYLTSPTNVYSEFVAGGTTVTKLNPTVTSTGSGTAYLLNTSTTLLDGDKLLNIQNHLTNKFAVNNLGAVTIGSVTKAQKTAMTPADGMLVYQTDNTPGFRGYVNGTWFILSTAADP